MKNRILSLILCALLVAALAVPASASVSAAFIDDQANLLTYGESNALSEKAEKISNSCGIHISILTLNTLNQMSAENYADTYYISNGFREILLLVSMSEREWYIYTSGSTIYEFSDKDIQRLGSDMAEDLGQRNSYQAFDQYLDAVSYHLEADSQPNLLLSIAIGIIVSGIVLFFMVSSMNTRHKQNSASGYMEKNSFRLRICQDLFLYSKVEKVRRQQNTSSGGKTTVHHNSGGRKHGGGGGKF